MLAMIENGGKPVIGTVPINLSYLEMAVVLINLLAVMSKLL